MHGVLGTPYRFFYSSKNYVPGLLNVMAKVKRPDDVTLGVFTLVETGDVDFAGTYYFDMVATQLMPQGEYTIIIKEMTSGHRQISKVTLRLPEEGSAKSSEIDVIGKLSDPGQIKGQIVVPTLLVAMLDESLILGEIPSQDTIKAKLTEAVIRGSINQSDAILGVLKEEC